VTRSSRLNGDAGDAGILRIGTPYWRFYRLIA
jgi:hypothetical protein